jgi:hypothetical protein
MHALRQNKHGRILHLLGDRRGSRADLIDRRLVFTRGDEYAREYTLKPRPPLARSQSWLEMASKCIRDPWLYRIREQPVCANRHDVPRGVARVRGRIRTELYPGRDEQETAEWLLGAGGDTSIGTWLTGYGCLR